MIQNSALGGDVDLLVLGGGAHASDAAALTAWRSIAARTHGLDPTGDVPAGTPYYNTATGRIRVADGSGSFDEYIPGAATKSFHVSAAVAAAGPDAGAGSADFNSRPARQLDGAATESVRFAFTMPADYADGTEIAVAIHCSRAAVTGGHDVRMRIDSQSSAAGGDLSSVSAGTAFTATLDGTADRLSILTDAQAVVPAGAGAASSEEVAVDVVRIGGDAADSSSTDLSVLGIEIRYTADAA